MPGAIRTALAGARDDILGGANDIDLWAVHPGGRTVLDAVEQAFALPPAALAASRGVLQRLRQHVVGHGDVRAGPHHARRGAGGQRGCAMSFGPGLVAETMMFRMAA